MSASLVFSAAAQGRPFIFSPPSPSSTKKRAMATTAEILAQVGAVPRLAAVVPASGLDVRPAPEMVSSGIPQLDCLTGGLPRGCLTEICGPASSGRTSVLLCALARATQRGEFCALVDASNAFDPASAANAGMEMSRLLWVRCGKAVPSSLLSALSSLPQHNFENSRELNKSRRVSESRLEQVLKVTDLLLQSNGFGMIALDLGDIPAASTRRIPLASWFRFRRAIEHTPTALLVLEQQPIAGSCSSALLNVSGKKLSAVSSQLSGKSPTHTALPHAELLDKFEITVELLRSRWDRSSGKRPVQSATSFTSRAAWTG
jgi:recA bacterial DNA recombination protein